MFSVTWSASLTLVRLLAMRWLVFLENKARLKFITAFMIVGECLLYEPVKRMLRTNRVKLLV